jgi:hypothetical protein
MKRRFLSYPALGLIILIVLGWIFILTIHFSNLDTNNPRSVFENMVGAKWPQGVTLKNWYFNNDREAIAVFYFVGNLSEVTDIIKTNTSTDFNSIQGMGDEKNFNLFFNHFDKLNLPDYSNWSKFEIVTKESSNYIYIFLNPNEREAICFTNSW